MRCTKCAGMGHYMGNGMILTSCHVCDGIGLLPEAKNDDAPINVVEMTFIDKRSKAYKDSIKDMLAANPSMTRDDAVKLFDNAYARG